MDLLALSRALIAADTVSHRGTEAAVRVLKPLYEEAGLAVQVQEEVRDGVRHQNLLGTYSGTDRAGLLLVTHLDTVDPGPLEMWTETEPHQLALKGDQVFGLGSADTKLDSLCKLFAARKLKGKAFKRSLQLLGTFEEEVGCKGAKAFARSPLFTARFAACSEPSELVIIRAHKGYAVVEIDLVLPDSAELSGPFQRVQVDGKAAHSSTPHLGVNAIEKALEAQGNAPLVSLEAGSVANKVPARAVVLRPGEGAEVPSDRRDATLTLKISARLFAAWKRQAYAQEPKINAAFEPSGSVVNWSIARIAGPRAELVFDCRLLPGHDPDALISKFRQEATNIAATVGGTVSKIDATRANPAMELKEPSELLAGAQHACRDVGLPSQPSAKPTNTEAGVFATAGIEALVFGPGRSTGNAHCANEHNLLSQMEKAIEFYTALITRLCL
ncbi:MAG: M20 family metallopeptidase [Myxococcaceae bacterium]